MTEASRMPVAIERGTGTVLTGAQWAQRAHLHRESVAESNAIYARTTATAHRFYRWRNRLLLTGFVTLIAARVLPAYIGVPR